MRFSDGLKDLNGAATREILKLTQRPEVISFAGGMPSADCMPCETVGEIAAEILSSRAPYVLQYGRTEGCAELNAELVGYLCGLGLDASERTVQVVSGGQQGLDLMCKAFVNAGDTVLVENPTYLVFLQIAKTYGANIVGVESGDEGLDANDLERKLKRYSPKLLYIVPTFSNPTGRTYSAQNRKEIVELCAKYDTVIIEDDPYGKLRYSGGEVPTVKSFDKTGSAVYVTSFSKTVAPGLRVAAVHGDERIVRKVSIGKQGADVQNPALTQLIIAEYLRRGCFYPNLERSISVYRKRRDAMLDAIARYMPSEADYTRPDGGLFVWMTLPERIDCKSLLPRAIEQNVAYINGDEFFSDGSGRNTLRLNFSNADEQKIDKGIKILSEIFKKAITEAAK